MSSSTRRRGITIPDSTSASIDRQAASEQLCRVGAELHAKGWCPGRSGNMSVAVTRDPLQSLITRADCDKSRLSPEDCVLVGVDGCAVEGEFQRPSVEAVLHTTVATLTNANAVLHTHSVWNTLLGRHFLTAGGLTVPDFGLLRGLDSRDHPDPRVFVPVLPNTRSAASLASAVKDILAEWPSAIGFLISGHGLYTWGSSVTEARHHVETLEFLFECVGRTTDLRPPL